MRLIGSLFCNMICTALEVCAPDIWYDKKDEINIKTASVLPAVEIF